MKITLKESGKQKNILLKAQKCEVNIHVIKGINAFVVLDINPSVKEATLEVELEENAELDFLCINLSGGNKQKILQKNKLKTGAKLFCRNVSLGSDLDHEMCSYLEGKSASSYVDFISYVHGKEAQNISVKNIFNAPNGSGEITIQAVAEDEAKVKCNGMIEIGENGGGTDTYLTEEVLMLDSTCAVDAIPALEIRTNDVKASHSATVAHVTQEDLFTFASRGIAPIEARKMFVLGFFGSFLEKISDSDILDRILVLLEEKYVKKI